MQNSGHTNSLADSNHFQEVNLFDLLDILVGPV